MDELIEFISKKRNITIEQAAKTDILLEEILGYLYYMVSSRHIPESIIKSYIDTYSVNMEEL